MKPSQLPIKSPARKFNTVDAWKVVSAFLWNASTLAILLIGAIIALPETDIPPSFIGLVSVAPFLNAILYGLQRWLKDNR